MEVSENKLYVIVPFVGTWSSSVTSGCWYLMQESKKGCRKTSVDWLLVYWGCFNCSGYKRIQWFGKMIMIGDYIRIGRWSCPKLTFRDRGKSRQLQ